MPFLDAGVLVKVYVVSGPWATCLSTQTQPHSLTPFAKVEGTRITYPSESLPLRFTEARSAQVEDRAEQPEALR